MRFINYLHNFSLDVALGAILYQLFWSKIAVGDYPPFPQIFALFLSIWLIYLIDRKIDFNLEKPLDRRHQFQWLNKKRINFLIYMLIFISLGNLLFLPLELIKIGLFISIGIGIYWFFWWKGIFNHILGCKEFFTAFFYTLGIGVSSWHQVGFNRHFFELFILLYLCVFQNLVLFSYLEDLREVKWKNILRVVEMVFILFLFQIILRYPTEEALHLISPFFFTFCLHLWIHYFAFSLQQRILGELAFFSPIIYFTYEFFSK